MSARDVELHSEDHDALELIADVSRELAETDDLEATLQLVAERVTTTVEGCDGASMMLVRGGRISSPAYSSDVARDNDHIQYRVGDGPCMSSLRDHETIHIRDLAEDQRWPRYRDAALELGIRSTLSFRLFLAEDTMGALNLCSSQPHAFDDDARRVGRVFATHAAVAMSAALSHDELLTALQSRDVIGQAKGILVERERLTSEQAFERLRELSNRTNRKLRDVAEEIVETGAIPDGDATA